MHSFAIEKAIKPRQSKFGGHLRLIKPGEECLVIKDFQGWKTNIPKDTAIKTLETLLSALKAKKHGVLKFSSPPNIVGIAILGIVGYAGYSLARRLYNGDKKSRGKTNIAA